MSVLFFSVIDRREYEPFVFPFVASALISQPDSKCEIVLARRSSFIKRYQEEYKSFLTTFGARFLFREIPSVYWNEDKLIHHGSTIRFLEVPKQQEPYTYISDIDMLFVEPILKVHQDLMEETGLPYTNIIRPSGRRLTGCQMATQAYFQGMKQIMEENQSIPTLLSDEELALQMIARSPLSLPTHNEPRFRPILAIHTSPNRAMFGNVGWGCSKDRLEKAKTLFATEEWQSIVIPKEYREKYLCQIENVIKELL